MKILALLLGLLACLPVFGQTRTPEDFGFRQVSLTWKGDPVDFLVLSQAGEEDREKPVFFFCQGSLPQPLIKTDGEGVYGVFPFNPDSLIRDFHLVIVGKPFVPVVAEVGTLGPNFTWTDEQGRFPQAYTERNIPDYYVRRNLAVIRYLRKQDWVSRHRLVVAGHSEGSTIALLMAARSRRITDLIYSGGNPQGRMMTMIQQGRAYETDTDSTRYGERQFAGWREIVAGRHSTEAPRGDSYKTTYDFSRPLDRHFAALRIPVLVSYGTADWSAPFNDLLRMDMIRRGKANIAFRPYIGTEHNYFPLQADRRPNHAVHNWDRVAQDWLQWLRGQ